MDKKRFFPAVVLLQLLFLSGLIFFYRAQLRTAATVLLETEPLDPFSAFRGRYVALNYKISQLPFSSFKDSRPQEIKSGDTVYVALVRKDKFWEVASAYRKKPASFEGVLLRGRAGGLFRDDSLRVYYGIESYFLSEKSANEIEAKQSSFSQARRDELARIRKEGLEGLSAEERRLYAAKVNAYWFNILAGELDQWVREGLIAEELSAKLKERYSAALDSIKKAEKTGGPLQLPLSVEVAVTKDGRGYPVKLFWEGEEYR